jgi:hypothetical protein
MVVENVFAIWMPGFVECCTPWHIGKTELLQQVLGFCPGSQIFPGGPIMVKVHVYRSILFHYIITNLKFAQRIPFLSHLPILIIGRSRIYIFIYSIMII